MNEKMIVPGGLKYLSLVYSSVINMIIFPSCYGIFSSRHDYLLSNPRDFLKSRGFIEIGKELIAAVILGQFGDQPGQKGIGGPGLQQDTAGTGHIHDQSFAAEQG